MVVAVLIVLAVQVEEDKVVDAVVVVDGDVEDEQDQLVDVDNNKEDPPWVGSRRTLCILIGTPP